MLCPQQEDRHLRARDRQFGAVISIPATGGNAICLQGFDPILRPMSDGIQERDRDDGSRVRISVYATQEEDGHLSARDRAFGAIHHRRGSASARDACRVQPLDERPGPISGRHIGEGDIDRSCWDDQQGDGIGWEAGGDSAGSAAQVGLVADPV